MTLGETEITRATSNTDKHPAVLIRTGGGNAPSLMGLRVLDRINAIRISRRLPPVDGIFPIASERQVKMLRGEANDPNRVLVDSRYAAIVDAYVASHGQFKKHIEIVATQSGDTKTHLMQRFGPNADMFHTVSIGSGETVTHSPKDIIGVLDAG